MKALVTSFDLNNYNVLCCIFKELRKRKQLWKIATKKLSKRASRHSLKI